MISRKNLRIIEPILFVLAGLAFFYFVYALAADGQDFSHLGKMLPFYLALLSPTYVLFLVHLFLYPRNAAALKKTYFGNGIALVALALIGLVMIIVLLANGTYHGLVQGWLTPLFPLDALLILLADGVLGGFLFYRARGFKDEGYLYFPYRHGRARRILSSIFRPIYVLASEYVSGAFLFGFGIANYSSPTFGYMIPVYLLMLLSPLALAYYEFFYKPKQGKFTCPCVQRKGAIVLLSSTLILGILWLLFSQINPNFFVDNATGYFPIDFMMSINAAPIVILAPLFGAGATALIASFLPPRAQ